MNALRSELHEDEARLLLDNIKELIQSFRRSALPKELLKDIAGHLDGILAAIPCEPDATAADAEQGVLPLILVEILHRNIPLRPLIDEIRWSEAVLTEKAKALRGADTMIRSTEEDIEDVQMKYAAQELLVRTLIERFGPELLLTSVDSWPKFLVELSHAADHLTNDPDKSWQYTVDVFNLLTEELVMDYLPQLPPDEQRRIGEAFKSDEGNEEAIAEELRAPSPHLEPSPSDVPPGEEDEELQQGIGKIIDWTTQRTGYAPPNKGALPASLMDASRILTRAVRDYLFP